MSYTTTAAMPTNRQVPPLQQPFQFSQYQYQPQVSQPIFPQPSGNIYFVNNSLEVANIPVGVGTSAVLCLSENLIYLKSMQNGMPMLLGYKITPMESSVSTPTPPQEDRTVEEPSMVRPPNQFEETLNAFKQQYEDKIKNLEDSIASLQDKMGGLVQCQF